jgi:polygalacturonase
MNRREWMASSVAGLLGSRELLETPEEDRLNADALLTRIHPPVFPKREFPITKFGAAGDGQALCTRAVADAIRACHQAGGGWVIVPKGRFLTGAVHLESNVNLHLEEGATLAFSQDPKHYLPVVFTRFEGTECMNYSPFVYAFDKMNIAVTGKGVLDGQAGPEHWWLWAGKEKMGWKKGTPNQENDRNTLTAMGDKDVPVAQRVFGEGHILRPNFIQTYRCMNVLFEDFRIIQSPMWEINPVLCRNVTMRGIDIESYGPNNDGCDPESIDGMLIERCTFRTGDDCIAVKSGRNRDGRRVNVPCQNLLIRDCVMKDGHGGVSIGSEVSGGIRNVLTENCQMSSPNLERALRIKTNSYRGGVIENIGFRNVTVGEVEEAVIEVDYFYQEGEGGPFLPTVRGVHIANVTSEKSKYAVFMRGYKNSRIGGVTVSDCKFENCAEGVHFENVEGVSLRNVTVNGKLLEERP